MILPPNQPTTRSSEALLKSTAVKAHALGTRPTLVGMMGHKVWVNTPQMRSRVFPHPSLSLHSSPRLRPDYTQLEFQATVQSSVGPYETACYN
jgi:hypothetical protein